ncbi:AsmA-like C-terminal region-containing protein [Winogradskyella flava]|uniref:AsmA-like C-terminal region-containing protein n=1 Tax=Winogradskyella flava TaxID=1884876 RepID=UPI00249251AE|nr:AsmA-like C-terminal region-containing protein [Winogradskyella flava]
MKYFALRGKKLWRLIALLSLIPMFILGIILFLVYTKQESILQNQISQLNTDYKGLIKVGKSHVSLFNNFPNISFKIDDLEIFETKAHDSPIIMKVEDIYVGFNLWDILNQNYDIQSLLIEEGFFNFVLHQDGTNNLENALKTNSENSDSETPLNIHLKKIELKNLDIHKLDESNHMDVETYIYWANGGFKTKNEQIEAHIDTEFKLNLIKNGDTTYIKNKHFEFDTDLSYNESSGMLSIQPTNVVMEHADFELEGLLDTKKNMDLDLTVKGAKSNFDMLIAFAPHDLIPVLESYNNAGNIYFNATVNGPITDNKMPFIKASFGTDKAYLENTQKRRRISDLGFNGHFTNGEDRSLESMQLALTNMNAKLERGNFTGSLIVKNFEHPEINAQLDVDFNIKFVADFFNIKSIQNTSGNIALSMNFHDIIDLNEPELTLNNLDQSYFTELTVRNLSITSDDLAVPLDRLDAHLVINGKTAQIDKFDMLLGKSDIAMTGTLSNFPAIIHHTSDTIETHLDITSRLIDIAELTKYSEADSLGINEQIQNLKTGVSFKASAKDFTEFKNLPKGEFFIDSLYAQLKHYPHDFHDFHADVLIDDNDMKIVDFTGYIDDSDFHLNGLAHNYGFWLQETLNGDVDLDFTMASELLRLEDIFTYKGENYVPKEYRHEMFKNLKVHLNASMHYKASNLESIDLDLDKLQAKMQLHPNTFEDFRGHFQFENDQLVVNDLQGKIGSTNFEADLNFHLGKDAEKSKNNSLMLKSSYIDFDALFKFNPEPPNKVVVENEFEDVKSHAEAFNIYKLPFTDMLLDVEVKRMKYHRIDLKNISGKLRMTKDHFIYVDTLHLDSAGGNFKLSGYFNGSDPKHIYFKPNLTMQNVDIDRLAYKFENFGQDQVLSENLHGKLTSKITGNVRLYPDMVPDLDQSEIHMNVKILEGRLEDYEPMSMFSDYIGDKNLKKIKFDTLQNKIDIDKGKVVIPNMTIESTLGHIEFSGTHDSSHNIEYYLRIPWKTVKKASLYKVFGNKKKADSVYGEEDIMKVDKTRRTRYLNLKIIGTLDDYDISLGKKKD